MKIISSILLFFLFSAVLAQADQEKTDPSSEGPTITTTETPTTDETITTTVATTTSPLVSTTSEPSTASTVPPTTTSSSAPSSSTAVSSTSESPVPTSSPIPSTTTPAPKPCQFNVTDGNVTCIRADIQAEFNIYVEDKKYPVVLGCDASYSGSDCVSSNDTQTLVLSESDYRLTMVFEKEKDKKIIVKNVTFSYNLPQGPRGTGSNTSENLFGVDVGRSYMCKTPSDIHLDNVTMEIHEIRIQAFLEDGKTYGPIDECEADEKVSDVVPIAVGIALAALIIIVLIAYLVGRRRSRQRGYQSV